MTTLNVANLGPEHLKAIEDLSGEVNFPAEQVNQLYISTLETLQTRARIKDYLILLVSKKVRSAVQTINRSKR